MSSYCERIKELLLGGDEISELELQKHLHECPECMELQQSLLQLDSLFTELPEIQPEEAVTARILADLNQATPSLEKPLTEKAFAAPVPARRSPAARNRAIVTAVLLASFAISRTGRSTLAAAFVEGSLGAIIVVVTIVAMIVVVPGAMFSPSRAMRMRLRAVTVGLGTICLGTMVVRSTGMTASQSFRSIGSSIGAVDLQMAPLNQPASRAPSQDRVSTTKRSEPAYRQRPRAEDDFAKVEQAPGRVAPEGKNEIVKEMEELERGAESADFAIRDEERGGKAGAKFKTETESTVFAGNGAALRGKRADALNTKSPAPAQEKADTGTFGMMPQSSVSSVTSAPAAAAAPAKQDADQMDKLSAHRELNRRAFEAKENKTLSEDSLTDQQIHERLKKLADSVYEEEAQNRAVGGAAAGEAVMEMEGAGDSAEGASISSDESFPGERAPAVARARENAKSRRMISPGTAPKLLSGVDAPIDGTPYETTFQLSDQKRDTEKGAGKDVARAQKAQEHNAFDALLRLRSQTENLNFESPVGYWENTYLPGSPKLRALQLAVDESLANAPKAVGELLRSVTELAAKPLQPFDAPSSGALGVQLNSDTRMINGEQRVLLQIGIRGADQLNTARQAIREQVIVDLRRAPSKEEAEKIRAVLYAIDQNKENRDRITMTFMTAEGTRTIAPKDLRYGVITAELNDILAKSAPVNTFSLVSPLRKAISDLASDTSAESAFSAPGLIIVTPGRFDAEFNQLSSMAYQASSQGIPLTVFATGTNPNDQQLKRLAIAGRGRATLVGAPESAKEIVRDELSNVGKVVAQAVRLNLKLHSGVKLVGVVDTKRLNTEEVQEVKAAEMAVDKRLSAALSIPMDRGEDGDGIQIIIPAFYGGDSHVVLVDVVASGPGQVATLTAQFKDLVQLGNKKIQVGLNLENGERQMGRAEYSVLQNFLSVKLAEELRNAAQAIRNGNIAEAERILRAQLELFQSVQRSAAQLQRSSDSRSMIQLLTNGLALLNCAKHQPVHGLSEVFEYAALRSVNDNPTNQNSLL